MKSLSEMHIKTLGFLGDPLETAAPFRAQKLS